MRRPVVLLLHLFYWTVYFCLLTVFFGMTTMYGPRHPGQFIYWNKLMLGFAFVPAALSFYASYSQLFPRLLLPGKIILLAAGLCAVSLLSVTIGEVLLYSIFTNRLNWHNDTLLSIGTVMLVNALLNGATGLGLKGFISWYEDLKVKEELTRSHYEMELSLIRMQLSPHFLFNTINNIDTLISRDPEKASSYLNTLSDILRFMLYETKAPLIPLAKELSYIESYIRLQQIRTANPDYVCYRLSGVVAGQQIPPMLFIPFIENAFKYSAPQKTGNAITIFIDIGAYAISFECTNEVAPQLPPENRTGGLGNELMSRRLDLLYHGLHQLKITDDGRRYTVALILPLKPAS